MIGIDDTHTCPVCGQVAPCIYTAQVTEDPFKFHNCHMCGSTWKEPWPTNGISN